MEVDENDPTVIQIAKLNNALETEIAKWEGKNIQIGINMFQLDKQFHALVEYLEVCVPTFDALEYEKRWKSAQLARMLEIRHEFEANETKESILQGIVAPDGTPINIPRNG